MQSLKQKAENVNRPIYEGAAKLGEGASRPSSAGRPVKVKHRPLPTCFCCGTGLSKHSGSKPFACAACKSVLYCSKECQSKDWKQGRSGGARHKDVCERSKRYMLRVPEVQAILKLFPWGKIESDGTFAEPLIRACFDVWGADGYGYWNECGSDPIFANDIYQDSHPDSTDGVGGNRDGYQLLLDQHFDDKKGWMLEDRLVPKLYFEPGHEPQIASSANVVDWKSWYEWRALPLDSPAALLMHYPLTVYHLLVNVLNVASPTDGFPGHRQTLDVHYIGPEVELNMLPIFSELALLLPHTDIKLTFFGYPVHEIVQKAGKKSIAAKAKQNEPVYTYEAPPSMGQSTMAIYLHGEHEIWHPLSLSRMNLNIPDAIVAPNAGLSNYTTWADVVLFCHVQQVPFGTTEYTEISLELERESFLPNIVRLAAPGLKSHLSKTHLKDLVKPQEYPIELNPFQHPGQRPVSCFRLPSVSNGFTIRVVGRDSATRGEKVDSVWMEELWEAFQYCKIPVGGR